VVEDFSLMALPFIWSLIRYGLYSKVRDLKKFPINEFKIENGADVDSIDDKGMTAIKYAEKNNNQKLIKILSSHSSK
jgi:ankyrin repeat protein